MGRACASDAGKKTEEILRKNIFTFETQIIFLVKKMTKTNEKQTHTILLFLMLGMYYDNVIMTCSTTPLKFSQPANTYSNFSTPQGSFN